MWAPKLKRQNSSLQYTRTRTYRIILIIVASLCTGIAALGYEVLNKSDSLPLISTGVTLLLLAIVLIAVVELFDNLKKEEVYLESKAVFLSVASHDLSSPLTGINWAAEALAAEVKDPRQRARLQAMEQSSRAMLQTVNDALSITSLESLAKAKLVPAPVDLLELIDGVTNGLKLTAAQKSVTLQRVGAWPSSYQILVDEKQFRRVVANIISNEIKFTDPNTSVTLSFTETAEQWSIAIHNEGPPISPVDQKRIFGLYERSEQFEKAGGQGTGFGLYLAQQIMLRHKGSIKIDPSSIRGVTFIITMPKNT